MSTRARFSILFLALGLLVSAFTSGALALVSLQDFDHGDRPVHLTLATSGALTQGVLTPGDALGPQELRISASNDIEYGLRPSLTGSTALADAINVEIRDANGDLLYAGPLREARINDYFNGESGRPLADGATDVLTVTGSVSLAAGNEIAGATIGITWEVSARPPVDSV